MSKKINVQQIIPFILPECKKQTSISKLIWSILELEEKLSNPQNQSIYFRLGIKSNIERLDELKESYEEYRNEFNQMTVDQCLEEIQECENIMYKARNLRPLFCRGFLFTAKKSRISCLKGFIQLKAFVDPIPSLEELERDQELLIKLLTIKP